MLIDVDKDWVFHFPTALKMAKTTIHIEKNGDDFTFRLPFGGSAEGIEVLVHRDSKSNKLIGTYHILKHDLSDEVEFEIQDGGKRLEGNPQGFEKVTKWVLERLIPQLTDDDLIA